MKLKHAALAAVMAVAMGPAMAVPTVVDWVTHDTTEFDASYLAPGSFDRILKFDLAGTFAALAVAVANDYSSIFNLSDSKVELFQNNGDLGNYDDDASLGWFSFDAAPVGNTFASLGTGSYYYRVTGLVDGSAGGSYVLTSTITPVPEPGTMALVLAGLSVVGFIARRRRPQP